MDFIYITFLIGNGFDINLGLNTRYADFYKYFLENASVSNMIKQWIEKEIDLWSDLELQLGKKVSEITDKTLDKFYLDKIELDRLLLEYLEKEQDRFVIDDNRKRLEEEFSRSIKDITDGFTLDDRDSVNNTKTHFCNEEYFVQFVSFNYTNALDKIVEDCKKNNVDVGKHTNNSGSLMTDKIGNVFHVHGTVEGDALLGVNDTSQIENEFLQADTTFVTTFVKRNANEYLGQQRTSKTKDIIYKSNIICVFGMSIGDTDKMWWVELVNWLIASNLRKLIIFWKGNESEFKRPIPTQVILLKNSIMRRFLDLGKGVHSDAELKAIEKQIMVIFNSKIFSFPRVK